jgi:hypothetical protein
LGVARLRAFAAPGSSDVRNRLEKYWSNILTWPAETYTAVPRLAEAERLAAAVRRAGGVGTTEPLLDLTPICRLGGFRVTERRLFAARGGGQALLSPSQRNRFDIWVDPEPPGGWQDLDRDLCADLRRHRKRFRIAHEIGHSFFFKRSGGEPRRLAPDSERQEDFANTFARALLVPRAVARRFDPEPSSAIVLHREYDISLEVAVRCLAAVHRDRTWRLAYWAGEIEEPEQTASRVQWCSACAATRRGREKHVVCWCRRSDRCAVIPTRRQVIWAD